MKRQYHPRSRSRSKPKQNAPKSCPQSRRASLSSEELSGAPLNLEALNDGLMSILECPVCFETMLPPIFQCKEGHNVCHSCKEKIKTCPMCRQLLIGRNVTVEHISNKLLRHCVNQDVGCKELVSLDNKEHHEKTCPFRKYECLPGEFTCSQTLEGETKNMKTQSCGNLLTLSVDGSEFLSTKGKTLSVWSLPAFSTNSEYIEEVCDTRNKCLKFSHINLEDRKILCVEKPNLIFKKSVQTKSWIKNLSSFIRRKPLNCVWSGSRFEILGHMKSAHPELASIGNDVFEFDKAKHEISLITALDEVFWLHLKRDPRKKLFFALVSYIGPEANASNYLYKFTIFSRKNGNKVSYTYQTPSDTANVDDLFYHGKAAVMNYKSVASFIDEKQKLPLKLKMKLMESKH